MGGWSGSGPCCAGVAWGSSWRGCCSVRRARRACGRSRPGS
jgi:hypothetical protein